MTEGIKAVLRNVAHRQSLCWRVDRRDGVSLYFTDHNAPLKLEDGNVYNPALGFSGSAMAFESGLKSQDFEASGILSPIRVSHSDMHAGRYRDAKVTTDIVDWLYPFAGPMRRSVHWILRTEYDGEVWRAELGGFADRLRHEVGHVWAFPCWHRLFDDGCKRARLETIDFFADIDVLSVDADTKRHTFRAKGSGGNHLPALGTSYFRLGKVIWSTGLNAGMVGEIRKYDDATREVELFLPMPFDIAPGDRFEIERGCNKLPGVFDPVGDCKTKYENIVNYGGSYFIPGTRRALETPTS